MQDAETALNNAHAAVKQTQADIASCNKELKTAQSEWTKAGKSLESFGKSCDSVSKNLNKAGKLLSTTLTTPIVALGTAAIKVSDQLGWEWKGAECFDAEQFNALVQAVYVENGEVSVRRLARRVSA